MSIKAIVSSTTFLLAFATCAAIADSGWSRYVDKYPSDIVGGRSFLSAIEKNFVSSLGREKWKRFLSYGPENPIRLEKNDVFGAHLIAWRCKAHNWHDENAFIALEAKTGKVVIGCFLRTSGKGKDMHREVEWIGNRWSIHVRAPSGEEWSESALARGARRSVVQCDEEDWGTILLEMNGPTR